MCFFYFSLLKDWLCFQLSVENMSIHLRQTWTIITSHWSINVWLQRYWKLWQRTPTFFFFFFLFSFQYKILEKESRTKNSWAGVFKCEALQQPTHKVRLCGQANSKVRLWGQKCVRKALRAGPSYCEALLAHVRTHPGHIDWGKCTEAVWAFSQFNCMYCAVQLFARFPSGNELVLRRVGAKANLLVGVWTLYNSW